MSIFKPIRRKIFFAIPFGSFSLEVYQKIADDLKPRWDVQIGSNIIKDIKLSSDVEMFRSRNKHLYDIFVEGIASSDIFIADISNTNPNVMLELGIAMQFNKSILILTSQDYSKLPFDINHFLINKYKSQSELIENITDHLDIFKEIKTQNFDDYIEGEKVEIFDSRTINNELINLNLPWKVKDFKLKLEYKFLHVTHEDDWLGIHARATYPRIASSELIYVRSNGKFETVVIPTRPEQLIAEDKDVPENKLNDGFTRLEITIDENNLQACTSDKYFDNKSMTLETFGAIYIQGNAHNRRDLSDIEIECRNLEIIRLDAVSPTS